MEKETLTGITLGFKGIFKFFSSIDILKVIIEKAWKIPDSKDKQNIDYKKSESNRVDVIVIFKLLFSIVAFISYAIYSSKTDGVCQYTWVILLVVMISNNLSTLSNIPYTIMNITERPKALSYIRASVLGVLNYFELVFYFHYLSNF